MNQYPQENSYRKRMSPNLSLNPDADVTPKISSDTV